ncbi:hypothetical protein ACFL21_02160 [Patescibacteria group bacterium]
MSKVHPKKLDTPNNDDSETSKVSNAEEAEINTTIKSEIEDVLFSKRFALIRYEISKGSEETMETWKSEIDQIIEALNHTDSKSLESFLTPSAKNLGLLDEIIKILETENLNQEEYKLFGIGIWLNLKKPRWKGVFRAGLKLLKGGRHSIDTILDPDDVFTCLDLAILTGELAKLYGISGGVYTLGKSKFDHRLWMSDKGQILDPNYVWERSGFCKDEDFYRDYVKNNDALGKSRQKQHSYPIVREQ